MKNSYGDCIYCGGKVIEQKERLDYRYYGQLFIMEDVPLGVCVQCSEKFLRANIAKKLEKLAMSTHKGIKTVAVPVLTM